MNRSEIMSRIRGRGNSSTEQRMISFFREKGISGWRRHRTILAPGGGLRYIRPDFIFPKERLVVLVDGCFWHGCKRCDRRPKTNTEYWLPKIRANRTRDRRATQVLESSGWRVVRIWEHALNGASTDDRRELYMAVARIVRRLQPHESSNPGRVVRPRAKA